MNRTHTDGREARRCQAWQLTPQGWSPQQITKALGVSKGAVSQWMTRAREGGLDALRPRSPPGAPRRLSAEQLTPLPECLPRGPDAYGFRGQLWTRSRLAVVIHQECGVWYHPSPVGRRLTHRP
jgi:transposase